MRERLIRFALGIVCLLLFAGVFVGVAVLLRSWSVGTLATYAVLLPIELLLYVGIVRLIERRRATELSPRGLPYSIAGLAIGIALFSLVVAVLVAAGDYTVVRRNPIWVIAAPLLFWTSGAISEELIFRGFIFRIVRDFAGTWVAVAISALLFGIAHAANPGATLWSSLAIAIEAGVLLSLAYAATGSLWLPIGIHIGWNFAEGTLYGTPVSGGHFAAMAPLMRGVVRGPTLLTGGAFGVEASIEALVICVAASVVLAVIVVTQHRRRGTTQANHVASVA